MKTINGLSKQLSSLCFYMLWLLVFETGQAQVTYFKYLDYSVQSRTEYSGWNGVASFFINSNYYIVGDTLIAGNWYYKQQANHVFQNTTPPSSGPFFIREDNNNRVYYYNTTTNADVLLMDWSPFLSLSVGSPWPVAAWNCSVTAIDSVQLGAQYLKRWHGPLSNTITSPYCIVEGVGVIGPICAMGIEGNQLITCYKKQNHQLSFVPTASNCAFVNVNPIVTGLREGKMQDQCLSLYPNPTADKLYIELKGADNLNAKLYHSAGGLVLTQSLKNKEALDVSALPKGLYLLVIDFKEQKIFRRVVVE